MARLPRAALKHSRGSSSLGELPYQPTANLRLLPGRPRPSGPKAGARGPASDRPRRSARGRRNALSAGRRSGPASRPDRRAPTAQPLPPAPPRAALRLGAAPRAPLAQSERPLLAPRHIGRCSPGAASPAGVAASANRTTQKALRRRRPASIAREGDDLSRVEDGARPIAAKLGRHWGLGANGSTPIGQTGRGDSCQSAQDGRGAGGAGRARGCRWFVPRRGCEEGEAARGLGPGLLLPPGALAALRLRPLRPRPGGGGLP